MINSDTFKTWETMGVGRKYITTEITTHLVCINVFNTAFKLEDYEWTTFKEREKIEAFLDLYVSDTLKKKMIKWIYQKEEK